MSYYPEFVSAHFESPSGTREMGDLLHIALGLASESGEFLDTVKKAWVYGAPLDRANLAEEAGDILFYLTAFVNITGTSFESLMSGNVAKLRKRYPDGRFTPEHAIERRDKNEP